MSNRELIITTIHYILTVVFFFMILVDLISLTSTTINMNVCSADEHAKTAKNLMISSLVLGYVSLLTIAIFIIICYWYSSSKTSLTYYETLMGYTGAENTYALVRIVTFSILMFISIVISSLCIAAAKEIDLSSDSDKYKKQYNVCYEMGKMLMLHFLVFTAIQGSVYLYKFYYDTKNIVPT